MSRHPNYGKMPPAAELRRIYLAGTLTFDQLAARYGVRRNSVYNKLARDARTRNLPWPLKSAKADWHRRAAIQRWDAVRTDLLRDEIRRCRWETGTTYTEIARRAHLRPNHIHQITAGLMTRVSRPIAERIVTAIDKIEREARHPSGDAPRAPSARKQAELERRELVEEMTRRGHGAEVIATRLGVSAKTVVRDRRNIRREQAA